MMLSSLKPSSPLKRPVSPQPFCEEGYFASKDKWHLAILHGISLTHTPTCMHKHTHKNTLMHAHTPDTKK